MEREAVLTDERLDDLERFRDIEFKNWKTDMERRFAEAFPGGDHVGHCRYHQLMIDDIEAKKKLRQAIAEKTISGLVWSAIVFLVVAALNYLKALARS